MNRYNPGMPLEQLSDEELIAQYRLAPQSPYGSDCVNALFERYYARVGRWCFRFTGDRESAADLAQEVFAKAYRRLDQFEGTAKFSTWLFVIARNESINAAKAREVRLSSAHDELPLDLPDDRSSSPAAAIEQESVARQLRHLLNAVLEDTERTVFTLHYGEDVPLDAITRLLALSNASGAKAYIVSAKRKLSRWLQREQVRLA